MASNSNRKSASKRKGRCQRTTSLEELGKLGVDINNAEGAIRERIDQFREGKASESTFVRSASGRITTDKKRRRGNNGPAEVAPVLVAADTAEVAPPVDPLPPPPPAASEVMPTPLNQDSMGWIDEVVAAVETIFDVNVFLAVELGSWIASKF